MAVNVHSTEGNVIDCEDAPVFLDTPLNRCPEEPYSSQECVLTEDLAPILNAWLKREIANAQEENGGGWAPKIGCRGLLCERAGIPERRLFGILQQEGASTTLDLADRLMLAIDANVQELPVYLAQEVRLAVTMQTELLRTVAKASGFFIPTGPDARIALPQARRKFLGGS